MTDKIVMFAGKKQSGKNTATNFVMGYTMTQLAREGVPYLPTRFTIDDEGDLIVNTPRHPDQTDDEYVENEGVLDIYSTDPAMRVWFEDHVYPHVRPYGFADMLKATASAVFGIPEELAFGTDEDKNTPTKILWKDMCRFLSPKKVSELKKSELYDKPMTIRKFLQYFGTNVCRKLYDDCWVESCFRRIQADQPSLAVICDGRFPNEVYVSKEQGAKVVRLLRAPFKDDHPSETELDKVANKHYDLVVPPDVTIREQNQLILDAMYDWGWFTGHLGLEIKNEKKTVSENDREPSTPTPAAVE